MSVPAMAPKTATKDMSKGKKGKKDKKSWVKFVVVDKQGLPVAWVKHAASSVEVVYPFIFEPAKEASP